MIKLKPFFSYYGGKWKRAPKYPDPKYPVIFEPFAGGAGYSIRHHTKQIILVEKDPRIVAVWRFLIESTPDDIMSLPLLPLDGHIDDLGILPVGGRELIRSLLNGATARGRNSFSSMAKSAFAKNPNTPSFWGAACRARIASQVRHIKHWIVIQDSYENIPNGPATWFVDPPYNNVAGSQEYGYTSRNIDFIHLGSWCASRQGQTIVCENYGADWLPFSELYTTHSHGRSPKKHVATEVVWING